MPQKIPFAHFLNKVQRLCQRDGEGWTDMQLLEQIGAASQKLQGAKGRTLWPRGETKEEKGNRPPPPVLSGI